MFVFVKPVICLFLDPFGCEQVETGTPRRVAESGGQVLQLEWRTSKRVVDKFS